MTKSKKPHLTEKEYNKIKELLGFPGMTHTLAVKVTKRSSGTLGYIKATNTLDEYRQLSRTINAKPTNPPKEQPIPCSHEALLEELIKHIKQINEKLDLVAVPKRRFF